MDGQGSGEQNYGRTVGQYANQLEIGHNEHEFLFDFGQSYQEDEQLHVHTRIVTGPIYAKSFLKLLQEAVEQYEESFGVIIEES